MLDKLQELYSRRNRQFNIEYFEISKENVLKQYKGIERIVYVPYGIKKIEDNAFQDSTDIKCIVLPDSVVNVSCHAFDGCENLQYLLLGRGIQEILPDFGSSLCGLNAIVFPQDVVKISPSSFNYCVNAEEVYTARITIARPYTPEEKGLAFENLVCFGLDRIENIILKKGNNAYQEAKERASEILQEKQKSANFSIKELEEEEAETETEGNAAITDSSDLFVSVCPGFEVQNGLIVNSATGEVYPDISLDRLGLTIRAVNALNRKLAVLGKKRQLSSLLGFTVEDLVNTRNMGVKTVDEVIDRVHDYLHAPQEFSVTESNALAPGYGIKDGQIVHMESGIVLPDASIDALNLSVRGSNACALQNITHVSELLKFKEEELRNFFNIGNKTAQEIIDKLRIWCHSVHHDIDGTSLEFTREVKEPVLAPQYMVENGVIYNCQSKHVVIDTSLDALQLSVRSMNCLNRGGYIRISQLVEAPAQSIRSLKNMGTVSFTEIQKNLNQYLKNNEHTPAETESGESVSIPEISQITDYLHIHEFEEFTIQDLCGSIPDLEEKQAELQLKKFVDEGRLQQTSDSYYVGHEPFFSWIQNWNGADERSRDIILRRASGETLAEIGQAYGMTRERVRQVEGKLFAKLNQHGLHFEEDVFCAAFQKYSFEKEFFSEHPAGMGRIWYYLNARYKMGNENLEQAVFDKSISVKMRKKVDIWIHRDSIFVHGIYIKKQRNDIEDFLLEHKCRQDISLDSYFLLYENFLREYGISDSRLQLTEQTKRTRSNRLADSMKVLWKQNQRLRYYDIEAGDYRELLAALNLESFHNTEISTRKFMLEYPELMEQYDIQDEYELHNLLKKIHAEKENDSLSFGRMPNLLFGQFKVENAVFEMMDLMSPVSGDDLAQALSDQYGTRKETILANWLPSFSEYYHKGVYRTNYKEMPEEHMQILKEHLTDNFYYISEIKVIYSYLIPGADRSLISSFNLKKLGFLVGNSYVIQNYDTAEAYFRSLLTSDDVIDIGPLKARYGILSTFSAFLSQVRNNYEIIEFQQDQYLSIHRLQQMGCSIEDIHSFCDAVYSFVPENSYFTMYSVKNNGFSHSLDNLGFSNTFYESLLKQDKRFSWQRVSNSVVFSSSAKDFARRDFLGKTAYDAGSIGLDALIDILKREYGINMVREDALTLIQTTDCYYDRILDRVYKDYETYSAEIR